MLNVCTARYLLNRLTDHTWITRNADEAHAFRIGVAAFQLCIGLISISIVDFIDRKVY